MAPQRRRTPASNSLGIHTDKSLPSGDGPRVIGTWLHPYAHELLRPHKELKKLVQVMILATFKTHDYQEM